MPGLLRCTCGDYARVLCFISHARLRVHWAPGIPCALYWAKVSCKTRANPAARSRSRIWLLWPFENRTESPVDGVTGPDERSEIRATKCCSSLRGAERRSNPAFCLAPMDCFAEPVIGRAFARPVGSQ